MDTTWGLFAQIPLAALFAYFIITFQRQNSASVIRNHEEWRDWLNRQQESNAAAIKSQQDAWMENMERLNERYENMISRQEARDEERLTAELEHRRKIVDVLDRLDERSQRTELMVSALYSRGHAADSIFSPEKESVGDLQ